MTITARRSPAQKRRRKFRGGDDKAAAIVEAAALAAAEAVRESYRWGVSLCESPIERMLLAHFVHPELDIGWDVRKSVMVAPGGSIGEVSLPPYDGIWLWPQIKIGPYRVDFIIVATSANRSPSSMLIVECDGHDFHERTKEQAQRDKARDRYLTGLGYRLLRFTGSEIYRDPEAVWDEIFKILIGLGG